MIVEKRFICKNTRQLVEKKIHLFRGDKKQETSNKCIVAIKIKVRYINEDTKIKIHKKRKYL